MSFFIAGEKVSDLKRTPVPEIAFVGRSNVGKSSLLNYLCGRKQLARTSHTPGRTQQIIIFRDSDESFQVADLPGYGYAEAAKSVQKNWSKNLSEYFVQRENLKGILFLFDSRREPNEEDLSLISWFDELQIPVSLILTKCDKVPTGQWPKIKKDLSEKFNLSEDEVVLTSTSKKLGKKQTFYRMEMMIKESKSPS